MPNRWNVRLLLGLVVLLTLALLGVLYPNALPWQRWLASTGLAPSPRAAMIRQWESAGFDTTEIGRQWLAARPRALQQGTSYVRLPLSRRLYFDYHPRAQVLRFTVPAGRILVMAIEEDLSAGAAIVELLSDEGGSSHKLVEAKPLGRDSLRLEVSSSTNFILTVEAPPLSIGNVAVRLSTSPQLPVFPVEGAAHHDIGSVWGDPRGGGTRKHEGIDIFAKRGTKLLAADAGRVTSVRNGGLGGKQVWLDVPGIGRLYYAHLDEQLVAEGTRVAQGDVLGTVGNSGNARTTPPHLHFGIYGVRGAFDPIHYVLPPNQAGFPTPGETLRQSGRLKYGSAAHARNTHLRLASIDQDSVHVLLPDDTGIQLAARQYVDSDRALTTHRLADDQELYTLVGNRLYATKQQKRGSSISILSAPFEGYAFAKTSDGYLGWTRSN